MKRIAARALLALLPIVLLGMLEFGLRAAGYPFSPETRGSRLFDRFRNFGITPLFVRRGEYFVNDTDAFIIHDESFHARKRPGSIRIFCVGGSAIAGFPFDFDDSGVVFAGDLSKMLSMEFPGREFEVINAGMGGASSFRLIPIVKEIAKQSPDLVIVMSGNNEFLEPELNALRGAPISAEYLFNRFAEWTAQRARIVEILQLEVRELRDQREPRLFPEEARAAIVAGYEKNLREVVRHITEAGAQALLVSPPMNYEWDFYAADGYLAASPEFRSMLDAVQDALYFGNSAAAADTLSILSSSFPEEPYVNYLRADQLAIAGDDTAAAGYYRRARESARSCYLGALHDFRAAMRRAAIGESAAFLDAAAHFETISPHGISGINYFLDSCHLADSGNLELASLVSKSRQFRDALELGQSNSVARVAPNFNVRPRVKLITGYLRAAFAFSPVAHNIRHQDEAASFLAKAYALDSNAFRSTARELLDGASNDAVSAQFRINIAAACHLAGDAEMAREFLPADIPESLHANLKRRCRLLREILSTEKAT